MLQIEPAMASKETVLLPIRHAPCTKLRDILQLKTVAELRSLAGLHGVRRIYQMRKDGLVTAIFDAMLVQDRMENILFLLDSASWRRLLKIAECGSSEIHGNSINVDTVLLEFCYLQAFLQDGVVTYVMPDEVRSAVLVLTENGFQARKERSDLIHAYAMSAINLYGVIAKDDLLKIFNMQNCLALNEEELDLVLLRQIARECGYVLLGSEIASEAFSYNQYRDIPDLLARVGNKPRYIPTKTEFLKYANSDYYEPTAYTQELEQYLRTSCHLDRQRLSELMIELHYAIVLEAPMQRLLDLFVEYGVELSAGELHTISKLLVELSNHTRLWSNNGHTPSELAGRPPVVGRADHKSKKIGRNDPCPCGSGKKYKRCCGR